MFDYMPSNFPSGLSHSNEPQRLIFRCGLSFANENGTSIPFGHSLASLCLCLSATLSDRLRHSPLQHSLSLCNTQDTRSIFHRILFHPGAYFGFAFESRTDIMCYWYIYIHIYFLQRKTKDLPIRWGGLSRGIGAARKFNALLYSEFLVLFLLFFSIISVHGCGKCMIFSVFPKWKKY